MSGEKPSHVQMRTCVHVYVMIPLMGLGFRSDTRAAYGVGPVGKGWRFDRHANMVNLYECTANIQLFTTAHVIGQCAAHVQL